MLKPHLLTGFLILVCLVCEFPGVQAQQATLASGGMASGTGGSVSYSIGQLVYTTHKGANGSVAQGVQQPYEIAVVSGIIEPLLNFSVSVFPNPTSGMITIQLGDNSNRRLNYHLWTLEGKLVEKKPLEKNQTQISLDAYPSGIYLLTITHQNKKVKSFKIVKN